MFVLIVSLTLVLASLVLLIIAGWWLYIRMSNFHVLARKIPGPNFYLPILGNSQELAGGLDHIYQVFQEKWTEAYGEIFRVFIGHHCYIGISSPELLETILNSQKIIDKGQTYENLVPWLGQGLLTSTGDYWRVHRKLLTPAFHFKILDTFIGIFNEQSRILCGILDDACRSFPQGKGELDVYPFLTRCSLDIICEAAMGTKINAQTEDSEYYKAVYRIGHVIMMIFQRPWLTWSKTIFSLSSLGRERNRLLKTLHSFTDDVVNKRRELFNKLEKRKTNNDEIETGIKNRLALLDMLLQASEDGKVLSHQEIRQEIDTFMFEGHDTTTSMLSWFLYSMAANPDCQEKVWDELQSVFGDSERDCSQEDIPNLKYLERCIKETLRMYPSVPGFERETKEDVQIGKYLVPAGSTLGCLTSATHRNPRIFPDPLTFNPDRFNHEESIGRHPYAFIPFSAGPRNCIGQRFAMLESKILLSTVLRRFKFEISSHAKAPVLSAQLVLKSITGFTLVVSRR